MGNAKRPIRVVIGKIGLDAHDRGVLVLINALRNAGMEVIFLGKFLTAEEVVKTAIEEDADVIGLSDHSGAILAIALEVMDLLHKNEADSICVVAGGLIPEEHIPILEKIGVTGNYTRGALVEDIINHIVQRVQNKRKQADRKLRG